ncbi:MAG: hypothetical protein WCD76_06490, partial [Pyrinomonadaceae bacterium]
GGRVGSVCDDGGPGVCALAVAAIKSTDAKTHEAKLAFSRPFTVRLRIPARKSVSRKDVRT